MTDDGISSRQIAKELRNVVRQRFTYKRRRSARQLAKSLRVSEATMRRVIQDDLHLHASHVTIQPNIQDDHKQRRKSFAYWVRKSLRKKDHGLILFIDEKYFGMDEGLTTPIIFKPGETLTHKNYIDIVLPRALAEGQRLLGEVFIYQQDNAIPHTHKDSLT
ncbi:unnamed protein product [Rotaria magnacalcarata]|uniref:Uncharacterized protein n=1 Tax=Rotaria magnacalcarata TaxID=392030 RepID=A0A820PK76_9BILA|nr:unnamed protein product [Rotaria magnacalcarata]